MKLSNFKFKLPENLIAQYPSVHRDECRLMVLDARSGKIEHCTFKDIINFFGEEDLFVFNDTKVRPVLLYGKKEKTEARIEVNLLRELNPDTRLWDILVEPARKIRIGNKLYFGEDNSMLAEVIDNTTSRGRTVRFLFDGTHEEFTDALFGLGEMPLPRFIKRPLIKDLEESFKRDYLMCGENEEVSDEELKREVRLMDDERYQTIFAKNEGAVVAPMAGCHFSRELLKRMEIKGIETGFLTLHASFSMFRDIDVEDLTKHKMDSEQMFVSEQLASKFNKTQAAEKRICAVGTTVLRGLETASTANGEIKAFEGWTSKFIFPDYRFATANALISNFQLPLSTMLMATAAFGGYDLVMNAYKVAVEQKYQFGSYGDALLILK